MYRGLLCPLVELVVCLVSNDSLYFVCGDYTLKFSKEEYKDERVVIYDVIKNLFLEAFWEHILNDMLRFTYGYVLS